MLYDIVIIGSGVAGLSAGIYAGRANKSVLIIEDNNIGGTTVTLPNINNYPGFTNISGVELVSNMYQQCLNFDVKFDFLRIDSIDFDRNIIRTDNNIIEYKTLIIASGSTYKRLNIDTEEKFKLRGLSYCAVCDGNLYKNKKIIVFTKNNSAINSVKYLKNLTNDIIVMDISNGFAFDGIECYHNVLPIEIIGDTNVKGIKAMIGISEKVLNCDGIFVDLGKVTDIDLYKDNLQNESGFLITDENLHTNIPNVFVAGDIRKKSLRQIVTACSDGAIASTEAIKYLSKNIF